MIRKTLRDYARAALMAHPHFAGVTVKRAWAFSVDAESLPCMAVSTPRTASEMLDKETTERRPQVQVMIRRQGGDDIEDVLDLDAEYIELIVLSALQAEGIQTVELRDTQMAVDGQGGKRVGTVALMFEAMVHTQTIFPEEETLT